MSGPLTGLKIVSIAVNLPGPVAASRFAELGATVTKVEPPTGDFLAFAAPDYYAELVRLQRVSTLDLKSADGQRQFDVLLSDADLLISSNRSHALARLGLDWPHLHERHPLLCHLAIVGHQAPDDDRPGHDLTYQAENGLVQPGALPVVLIADLLGAERAVTEGLALIRQRAATGRAEVRQVSLARAAGAAARPLHHRLTGVGAPLGGSLPGYAVYAASDGHVALAALEPHFLAEVVRLLSVEPSRPALAAVFATRSAAQWQKWAQDNGIPLVALS